MVRLLSAYDARVLAGRVSLSTLSNEWRRAGVKRKVWILAADGGEEGDDGLPGTPWTPPEDPPNPDGTTPPDDGTHRE